MGGSRRCRRNDVDRALRARLAPMTRVPLVKLSAENSDRFSKKLLARLGITREGGVILQPHECCHEVAVVISRRVFARILDHNAK